MLTSQLPKNSLALARYRAIFALAWFATGLFLIFQVQQAWYLVNYQLDSTAKVLSVSGAQGFSASAPLAWLILAAAAVCSFTPKGVARAIAVLVTILCAYSAVVFLRSGTNPPSQTIQNLVAKAAGISDQYQLQVTSGPWLWVAGLAIAGLLALGTATMIHVSPRKPKTKRFEINQADSSNDAISLWDSQS